jgi:hypothetical protein
MRSQFVCPRNTEYINYGFKYFNLGMFRYHSGRQDILNLTAEWNLVHFNPFYYSLITKIHVKLLSLRHDILNLLG